jgi:hypothetical protein
MLPSPLSVVAASPGCERVRLLGSIGVLLLRTSVEDAALAHARRRVNRANCAGEAPPLVCSGRPPHFAAGHENMTLSPIRASAVSIRRVPAAGASGAASALPSARRGGPAREHAGKTPESRCPTISRRFGSGYVVAGYEQVRANRAGARRKATGSPSAPVTRPRAVGRGSVRRVPPRAPPAPRARLTSARRGVSLRDHPEEGAGGEIPRQRTRKRSPAAPRSRVCRWRGEACHRASARRKTREANRGAGSTPDSRSFTSARSAASPSGAGSVRTSARRGGRTRGRAPRKATGSTGGAGGVAEALAGASGAESAFDSAGRGVPIARPRGQSRHRAAYGNGINGPRRAGAVRYGASGPRAPPAPRARSTVARRAIARSRETP